MSYLASMIRSERDAAEDIYGDLELRDELDIWVEALLSAEEAGHPDPGCFAQGEVDRIIGNLELVAFPTWDGWWDVLPEYDDDTAAQRAAKRAMRHSQGFLSSLTSELPAADLGFSVRIDRKLLAVELGSANPDRGRIAELVGRIDGVAYMMWKAL